MTFYTPLERLAKSAKECGWDVKADPAVVLKLIEIARAAVSPKMDAITDNLHTQDNRITSHPLFAVQQRRRIYGLDADYRDGVVWVNDEGGESPVKVADSRKVGYRDTWEFVTGCFTEQGCKDFIACNGHNLHEPRIYAYSGYRNAEFIAVREWLMGLRAALGTQPVKETQ